MSSSFKSLAFTAFLLVLAVLPSQDANAMAIRSRPVVGTVQTFNVQTGELIFMAEGNPQSAGFVVTKRTRYVLDWNSVHPSDLKPGTKATIYYRKPFFGKPFIAKVAWQKAK